MTDSAGKTPDRSLIRTVTLQRLAPQLKKMEKARRRSIPCSAEYHGLESHRPEFRSPESHSSEPPEKAISTGIEASL
jgi:hypothetical protein